RQRRHRRDGRRAPFGRGRGDRRHRGQAGATCGIPSIGGGWSGSLRRLVAASLLVVAAAGCRTYPPLEPVRLAALETDLGQLLLVGFEGTEAEGNQAVERLLCETRVGGVVLFARNITGDEQAGRLTRALAERARACTGRPLLIAVDAEGGQVMRLGAGLTATLSAGELGES